jgi:aminomethyltransferase
VNDASKVEVGQAQYSAMCLESGGIVDDLLIYRYADRYMLVVNASNLAKDWAWIGSHAAGLDVELEDVSAETALLALQGPAAREILRPWVDIDLDAVTYYRFTEGKVAGVPATIAGTGYTGEDGFELYVASADVVGVWRKLLQVGTRDGLVPVGLGARDSLRLEMGYALYGNELDADHTPLEAGLGWITKLDKGEFVGRDALVAQRKEGIQRRMVGLVLGERAFPRHGYDILADGEAVGLVTSGTVSPSLGIGVAMGYVPAQRAAPGTKLQVDARGRALDAVVARPPFYTQGSIRR